MESETIAPAKKERKLNPPSPYSGSRLPIGRPKGVQNKVTRSIREAVEIAAREVTDSQGRKGLAAWLLERANGNIQDRQIFAAMVAKVVPLQVQAQGGGVTINLGWLAGRQLVTVNGTATSQSAHNLLIEQGDTRNINPQESAETATDHQADNHGAAEGDPHPPFDGQAGGG